MLEDGGEGEGGDAKMRRTPYPPSPPLRRAVSPPSSSSSEQTGFGTLPENTAWCFCFPLVPRTPKQVFFSPGEGYKVVIGLPKKWLVGW